MTEQVNHPPHYASGKIEVIEALEDWKLDFHSANAVKYIARAGKKDPNKEIEDLEKAVWYLKRKIENLRALKENRAPVRPNDMNPRPSSVTGVCAFDLPEHLRDTATIAAGMRYVNPDGSQSPERITRSACDSSAVDPKVSR